MSAKNIFAGKGIKTTFVKILYGELMRREYITLADIMCLKRRYPKGYYDNNPKATLSREMFYGDLKKASSELIKALEQVCPGCIEDNGKTGKGKAFRYVGEKGAKVEEVILQTKTEYQHGLLLTKPLHHSQRETLPFGEHGGQWYGEVRLTIEPNRELRGRILLYGENLEVVSPQSLREQIKDTLTKQMAQYRE